MSTPRQARSLDVLLAEVNAHAPSRSKASDGGLGDQAHAARESDHNPNTAGVWRARDFTDDPAGGLDGSELAHLIAGRLGKHPALSSGAYVIHNARIISTDRLAEGWRPYAGLNAHKTHVHVSVSTHVAGYDSTRSWDLWGAPEPPPAPAKPSATERAALTRLRNAWRDQRTLHWGLLDAMIRRGEQPAAGAAKTARDKVAAAMTEFFNEVDR